MTFREDGNGVVLPIVVGYGSSPLASFYVNYVEKILINVSPIMNIEKKLEVFND
ncbi:MAG TPA: hypothetical protein VE594_08240 [Nitrososphaeraceae archaeon]|nr:hypothetical protein [Nitrososphaeraceae archaeon]